MRLRRVDDIFGKLTLHHIFLRKHRKAQEVCIYFFLVEQKNLSHQNDSITYPNDHTFSAFLWNSIATGPSLNSIRNIDKVFGVYANEHGCAQDMVKAI